MIASLLKPASELWGMSADYTPVSLPPLIWDQVDRGFVFPLMGGKAIANCISRYDRRCRRIKVGDTAWEDMPSHLYEFGWTWNNHMDFGTKTLFMGVGILGHPGIVSFMSFGKINELDF